MDDLQFGCASPARFGAFASDSTRNSARDSASQMHLTANIGGGDYIRPVGGEVREFALLQLSSDGGLQDRIRTRRTAAQMRIVDCDEFMARGK